MKYFGPAHWFPIPGVCAYLQLSDQLLGMPFPGPYTDHPELVAEA